MGPIGCYHNVGEITCKSTARNIPEERNGSLKSCGSKSCRLFRNVGGKTMQKYAENISEERRSHLHTGGTLKSRGNEEYFSSHGFVVLYTVIAKCQECSREYCIGLSTIIVYSPLHNTGSFCGRCREHHGCYGKSRRMQAFWATKLAVSVRR